MGNMNIKHPLLLSMMHWSYNNFVLQEIETLAVKLQVAVKSISMESNHTEIAWSIHCIEF